MGSRRLSSGALFGPRIDGPRGSSREVGGSLTGEPPDPPAVMRWIPTPETGGAGAFATRGGASGWCAKGPGGTDWADRRGDWGAAGPSRTCSAQELSSPITSSIDGRLAPAPLRAGQNDL